MGLHRKTQGLSLRGSRTVSLGTHSCPCWGFPDAQPVCPMGVAVGKDSGCGDVTLQSGGSDGFFPRFLDEA